MSNKGEISKYFKLSEEGRIIERYLSLDPQSSEAASLLAEINGDPFLSDALEGYQSVSSSETSYGLLEEVTTQVTEKTGARVSQPTAAFNPSVLMSVAAGALVLIIAGIWFMNRELKEVENPEMADATKIDDLSNKHQQEKLESSFNGSETAIDTFNIAAVNSIEEILSDSLGAAKIIENEEELSEDAILLAQENSTQEKIKLTKDKKVSKPKANFDVVATDVEDDKVNGDVVYDKLEQGRTDVRNSRESNSNIPIQTDEITVTKSSGSSTGSSYGKNAIADRGASFPSGAQALKSYLQGKATYPKKIEEDISGQVTIRVEIDERGRPKNPVVTKSLHPSIDKDALKVVKGMPKWTPAVKNGEKISTTTYITISYNK